MAWKSDTFRVRRDGVSGEIRISRSHEQLIDEVVKQASEVVRDNREKLDAIQDPELRKSATR